MEQLRRWREPVAAALLVVAGLRLLVGILAVPVLASAYDSISRAAMFEAVRTFDVALLVAAGAAAASCFLAPVSARARLFVTIAVIEVAIGVLAALVYGLMGLSSGSDGRAIEFVYLLLGLVLPVLVMVGLLLLLRQQSAAVTPVVPEEIPAPLPAPTASAAPPAWQPEHATGRVWTSAGEAARGVPGADWSAETGATGWQPIPGEQPPR